MKSSTLFYGFLAALLFSFSTHAGVEVSKKWKAPYLEGANEIKKEVEFLVKDHFPRLVEEPIEILPLKSKSDFFESRPIFRDKKRIYSIRVNPYVFDHPPGKDAIRAILVHELDHVEFSLDRTVFKLIAHGIRYTFDSDFVVQFERETDEVALKKGFAKGLSTYRTWLYKHVAEEDLEKKQLRYYTPEEIDAWVQENERK